VTFAFPFGKKFYFCAKYQTMNYEENNNHESMASEPSEALYGLDYLKKLHEGMSFEDLRAAYIQEKYGI
jgi:hypothetical protein